MWLFSLVICERFGRVHVWSPLSLFSKLPCSCPWPLLLVSAWPWKLLDQIIHSTRLPSGSGPEALFKPPPSSSSTATASIPISASMQKNSKPLRTPARRGEQYFSELDHIAESFALSGEEDTMQLTLGFILFLIFITNFDCLGIGFAVCMSALRRQLCRYYYPPPPPLLKITGLYRISWHYLWNKVKLLAKGVLCAELRVIYLKFCIWNLQVLLWRNAAVTNLSFRCERECRYRHVSLCWGKKAVRVWYSKARVCI